MNNLALQRHISRGALRRWRSWFRNNGAHALLAFVLAVCLAEPLACFIHCRLWEWSHHSLHDHAHHHHAAHSMHAHENTAHGPTASSNAATMPGMLCMMEMDNSASSPPVPLPISSLDHQAALMALLLLFLTAQLVAIVATPPRSPPDRSHRPLVPPPILLERW